MAAGLESCGDIVVVAEGQVVDPWLKRAVRGHEECHTRMLSVSLDSQDLRIVLREGGDKHKLWAVRAALVVRINSTTGHSMQPTARVPSQQSKRYKFAYLATPNPILMPTHSSLFRLNAWKF